MKYKTKSYSERKKIDDFLKECDRDMYPEFFSLVVKPNKKKRKCLRCGVEHVTDRASHRMCKTCQITIRNVGALGTWVAEVS